MGNIWKTYLSIISNSEIVHIGSDARVREKQRAIDLNSLFVSIDKRGKGISKKRKS